VLGVVQDRKDRVLSKLYRRRLEIDFVDQEEAEGADNEGSSPREEGEESGGTKAPPQEGRKAKRRRTLVQCCEHCGVLYPAEARGRLHCPHAADVVDYWGRTQACHSPIQGTRTFTVDGWVVGKE
jgi:hypothetical protein